MTNKWMPILFMAVAGLFLPAAARAQGCGFGYCESWAIYDPGNNTIVGYSYYENTVWWYVDVESVMEDPHYGVSSLCSEFGFGSVNCDFSYVPQGGGGTYSVAGFNWYFPLFGVGWYPDGESLASVYVPESAPPQITSCDSPPWQIGWNYFNCYGQGLSTSSISVNAWGNGGMGFLQGSTVAVIDDSTVEIGASIGLLTYLGWLVIDATNSAGAAEYDQQVPPPQPPVITSISPDTAPVGQQGLQLTIYGSNFGTTATVNLPQGVTNRAGIYYSDHIVLTVDIVDYAKGDITVTANGMTSNGKTFTGDGPYYLWVISDQTGFCDGCQTTVERDVTYGIANYSGTNASTVDICEQPAVTGWSCKEPTPHPVANWCSGQNGQGPQPYTAENGSFTDSWSLAIDGHTPTGCGFDITDPWKWYVSASVQRLLGTLSGYVHTDHIQINGVTSPDKIPENTIIGR